MTTLEVSKFEVSDLQNLPRLAVGRRRALVIVTLPIVAAALATIGAGVLIWRNGFVAVPAAVIAGGICLIVGEFLFKLLRRKPVPVDRLERLAVAMSPTRAEFADDRLRLSQPLGSSAYRYDALKRWFVTPTAYFLWTGTGVIIFPIRYVTAADAAVIAEHLAKRGVRIG